MLWRSFGVFNNRVCIQWGGIQNVKLNSEHVVYYPIACNYCYPFAMGNVPRKFISIDNRISTSCKITYSSSTSSDVASANIQWMSIGFI